MRLPRKRVTSSFSVSLRLTGGATIESQTTHHLFPVSSHHSADSTCSLVLGQGSAIHQSIPPHLSAPSLLHHDRVVGLRRCALRTKSGDTSQTALNPNIPDSRCDVLMKCSPARWANYPFGNSVRQMSDRPARRVACRPLMCRDADLRCNDLLGQIR